MLPADLYIVAAGNGSRMNASLPKALVPITDRPCLTTTLQQIGQKFRHVFIVTNVQARDAWQSYFRTLAADYPEFAELTVNLPIVSGLGDGHATLQGLLAADRVVGSATAQEVVVVWGDVFFIHSEIIDELLAEPINGSGLLPAVFVKGPYVALLVNARMHCISADFSKYGETHSHGFHDQSVFRFCRATLLASLQAVHNSLWKGGRYITASGELSLLYTLHYLYNSGAPAYVYETRYPTRSFNTIHEVAAIQAEITSRLKQSTHQQGVCDSSTHSIPPCRR